MMLGHAKQIITVDVCVDKHEIMDGYLDKLNPFIEEVLPKPVENKVKDYTKASSGIMVDMQALYEKLTAMQRELRDYSDKKEIANILNFYYMMIKNMSFA